MLPVALCMLLATDPPLVTAPDPVRAPVGQPPEGYNRYPMRDPAYVPRPRAAPLPAALLPPPSLALFFAPISLFSLTFWLEADVALGGGLDVFANVGGGPLGQFGFDAGFRYYVLGTSLEGFFLDARGSGFSLPASNLWMLGPGLMIGHGWRVKRFTLSIAIGVSTWYGVSRAKPGAVFFGSAVADAEVIAFPGLNQPPQDHPAVQPTFRVSMGPWF